MFIAQIEKNNRKILTKMADFYPDFVYTTGRPLKYKPAELLEKFKEYIQWLQDNRVEAESTFIGMRGREKDTEDKSTTVRKQKLYRPATIAGFLVHLGASERWWKELDEGRNGKEFSKVKSYIKEYCENNQIDGASIGIFNGNIISRLLGLADKNEVTGKDGKDLIPPNEMTREEILAEIERIRNIRDDK